MAIAQNSAKQDVAFLQQMQMQATKAYCESGAALSSIAKIMMRRGVSATEAMSNRYDQERISLMMAEGVDGRDAEVLVSKDVNVLLAGSR